MTSPHPSPLTPHPMRIRAIVLILVLVGCGLATAFRSTVTGYHRPTEAWLEDQIPARIGDFTFIPSAENPKQSYRMDAQTYEKLDPIGIVCRKYTNGTEDYDAVVIMGDDPNTFHDQTWCFQGQGWTTEGDETIRLRTRNFGDIPARLIDLQGERGPATMVFTFRGPSGRFHNQFAQNWRDYFFGDFLRGTPRCASFYRFVTPKLSGSELREALTWCAAFIDASAPGIGSWTGT